MPSYVITGANRGIGIEFVRQLSADPANTVFGLVRNKGNSQDLLALEKERANVRVLEADVTDAPRLRAAADEVAKATGGTLEYLINNAAYVQKERFDYDPVTYGEKGEDAALEADLDQNFRVNVLGVVHTTNAFLPLLRAAAKHTTARVITLSSGVGDVDLTLAMPFAGALPYCASKAAVNMVVAKYAAKFTDENLVFLAISPGLVDTSTSPPTPEELKGAIAFITALHKVYPDWEAKPLTPTQSVTAMLKVIPNVERKDSGAFVSHLGSKKWV